MGNTTPGQRVPKPIPNTITSTYSQLRKIKSKRGKLSEAGQGMYDELIGLFQGDLRGKIDAVVGLSAADRRAVVTPSADLEKRLKKEYKPNSRTYSAPPRGTMKRMCASIMLYNAWLKNRHKYKDGELLAPVSDDDLLGLQEYLRGAMDQTDYLLPSHFVDSYRICGGMSARVRTHSEEGLQLFSIEQIKSHHRSIVKDYQRADLLPISDNGAGNYYALKGTEVCDLNHEDKGVIATHPHLAKLLSRAHKPWRW